MKFIICDTQRLQNCITHISNLPLDKGYRVTITNENRRSLAQNSLYWLWLTEIAAQDNYHGKPLTKEQWHYLCGLKYLGVDKIEGDGIVYRVPKKSTKDLGVGAFMEYLTQIEADFLERGNALSFPDYYGEAMLKS